MANRLISQKINKRERAFAEHFVLNGSYNDALLAAGYPEKATYTATYKAARALAEKPKMVTHITELRKIKVELHEIDEFKLIQNYRDKAEANILDYYDDNDSLKPFSQLTAAQGRNIKKIKQIETEYGTVTELTLHDPYPALAQLTKMTPLHDNARKQSAPVITFNLGKQEKINVIEHTG